jgi:D-amino peptidase
MRVLVSVDIEGVAGVSRPEQTLATGLDYGGARRLMTEEANAAVAGACAAGADDVIVADAHGSFGNILPDLLDPRARLLHGKPRSFGMLEGIQERPDAVMLIGYHAMASGYGVLAHTIRGTAFHHVWVNERPAGEAALYGLVAGQFGVPVVLASGDDRFREETLAWLPRTRFAVVKQAMGNRAALSLAPVRARALIQEEAQAALAGRAGVGPLTLEQPLVCRVEAKTPALADVFALLPSATRTGPLTLHFSAESPREMVGILNLWSAAAASV